MDCALRYAAYIANILLLLALAYVFYESHGRELPVLLLAAIPPVLSLCALRRGLDLEERRLMRQVHKARLRKELAELES